MLSKSDLPLLYDFSRDFDHSVYVRDRESEGINEGRPSRGVAIFWRKYLSSVISPLVIDDSLIGITLTDSNNDKILFLKVLSTNKMPK